jgi:hypothetical protein
MSGRSEEEIEPWRELPFDASEFAVRCSLVGRRLQPPAQSARKCECRCIKATSLHALETEVKRDQKPTAPVGGESVEAIVAVWRADTSAYANLEKLRAGAFDLNGVTGLSDFSIWRQR